MAIRLLATIQKIVPAVHELQQLHSDLAGIYVQVLRAVITADWLPLVAIWGLGICAVEGIEHLDAAPPTRHSA